MGLNLLQAVSVGEREVNIAILRAGGRVHELTPHAPAVLAHAAADVTLLRNRSAVGGVGDAANVNDIYVKPQQ